MTVLCVLETTVLKTLLMNGTTLINGTNQDNVLKSKDITLPTKVHTVKAMIFPVVRYGCERRLSTKELILSNCGAGEDS